MKQANTLTVLQSDAEIHPSASDDNNRIPES